MSNPSGVAVGQGVGVPTEFIVKSGILQRSYSAGMKSAANRGALVVPTAVPGEVDLADHDSPPTLVAGLLGQDVYNPASLPASVANNIFADGILQFSQTGQACSVWKIGEFQLTNITGSVTYGQFLIPDTAGGTSGNLKGSSSNTITNGCIVAMSSNATAGGAVLAAVNLT